MSAVNPSRERIFNNLLPIRQPTSQRSNSENIEGGTNDLRGREIRLLCAGYLYPFSREQDSLQYLEDAQSITYPF
jgi:hypothetical protein